MATCTSGTTAVYSITNGVRSVYADHCINNRRVVLNCYGYLNTDQTCYCNADGSIKPFRVYFNGNSTLGCVLPAKTTGNIYVNAKCIATAALDGNVTYNCFK